MKKSFHRSNYYGTTIQIEPRRPVLNFIRDFYLTFCYNIANIVNTLGNLGRSRAMGPFIFPNSPNSYTTLVPTLRIRPITKNATSYSRSAKKEAFQFPHYYRLELESAGAYIPSINCGIYYGIRW